jgi:hypothetical protein
MNVTRIVRTIPPNEPSVADVFRDYFEKYKIKKQ